MLLHVVRDLYMPSSGKCAAEQRCMAHDLAMCSNVWSVIMSWCCTCDLALHAHFDGTLLHALILLVQKELAFFLAFVYLT